MTQTHAPGSPATVSFGLTDAAGETIEPTALRWRVLDENEVVLQDWTVITPPVPAEPSIALTIIGALNILTAPATRGVRTVELEITTAMGQWTLSESLVLQGGTSLVLGYSTYITYPQALMLVPDFTDQTMGGWLRFTDRVVREQALSEAFHALRALPIVTDGTQRTKEWLSQVEQGEFLLNTTAQQRAALARAQLIEASAILEADPVTLGRRNGMVSMTVGESSQYYGQTKALDVGVASRLSLTPIKPWLNYTVRIGRSG